MTFLHVIFVMLQVLIGYNLILPFILFVSWKIKKSLVKLKSPDAELDYAIIITAYEQIDHVKFGVESILRSNYSNYIIYIVADNCDITNINFDNNKVILLKPTEVLSSNTKSHEYAVNHFIRKHHLITIIDSDNLIHAEYFNELNKLFAGGFDIVQGFRKAKNVDSTIAALDSARDLYYHFYDGKLLFELGSSATLSGSGMAFRHNLYRDFLAENRVDGPGFDKVLQYWLLKRGYRIAFTEDAIVYDEKTSKADQLVKQRSRWINTWFKYFSYGFRLINIGMKHLSRNQFLFGIILLRPPLFIFIIVSLLCMFVNLIFSPLSFLIWFLSFIIFILSFVISLKYAHASIKIYESLFNIPKFIYYQMLSLFRSGHISKQNVATKHSQSKHIDDL